MNHAIFDAEFSDDGITGSIVSLSDGNAVADELDVVVRGGSDHELKFSLTHRHAATYLNKPGSLLSCWEDVCLKASSQIRWNADCPIMRLSRSAGYYDEEPAIGLVKEQSFMDHRVEKKRSMAVVTVLCSCPPFCRSERSMLHLESTRGLDVTPFIFQRYSGSCNALYFTSGLILRYTIAAINPLFGTALRSLC